MQIRIKKEEKEAFLFLNGIEVPRPINIRENLQILPAKCRPTQDLIIELFKNNLDIGVAAIFLYQIKSQIKVSAKTPKELAARAWNSIWDGIFLSAIFDCEAVCNFQSNTSADKLPATVELILRITILEAYILQVRLHIGKRLHMV